MLTHEFTLAVLCGGESTRLGTDKGLYRHAGDESLVARAIRLLSKSANEVLIVCHDEAQRRRYKSELLDAEGSCRPRAFKVITDQGCEVGSLPRSALTGVATALVHSRYERVIVVGVDQLGVRLRQLEQLLSQAMAMPQKMVICFGDQTGDPLPFPSIWSVSALPALLARLSQNACSVRSAIRESAHHLIEQPSQRTYNDPLSVNSNTLQDMNNYFGQPLIDPRGRRLKYLRFSLTEACNMACTYCLPDGFPEWYRHKATLTLEQITTLLTGFRKLGFSKVRFTGGEPSVHRDCLQAIEIADSLGFECIAMTTNGLLLGDLRPWIKAGLTNLNVSLDSLDPIEFQKITKSSQLTKVLALIDQAVALGVSTKINTVLMRSINGSTKSINNLIDWAAERPLTLRFIELMDTGLNQSFATQERVLGTEIESLLINRGFTRQFKKSDIDGSDGPAVNYSHQSRPGLVGLINPLSGNFCSSCNRLRITARGHLKLCLFGNHDSPLDLSSASAVALNVRQLIGTKPERHYLDVGNFGNVATFRTIGG